MVLSGSYCPLIIFILRYRLSHAYPTDCRYVPDCRSRGHEYESSPVPYFMEIDHEIISMAILLPSADSRRVVVSYKLKYVHKVLVKCLVKLAVENSVVR